MRAVNRNAVASYSPGLPSRLPWEPKRFPFPNRNAVVSAVS